MTHGGRTKDRFSLFLNLSFVRPSSLVGDHVVRPLHPHPQYVHIRSDLPTLRLEVDFRSRLYVCVCVRSVQPNVLSHFTRSSGSVGTVNSFHVNPVA